MLKTTISKSASRSGSRTPGLFPGENGSEASRRISLRKVDAEPRLGPGTSARTACNVNYRIFAAPTRDHAGARAVPRRLLPRKASRRSFASDAIWRSTESGTRKTGISTSGNSVTSSFGRSKANNWNGEGEVKNPAVTATTRSASPNRFHAETR